MFKKIKPSQVDSATTPMFPHCDPRILHAPGECKFCDVYPNWQELRQYWGIAFTGYEPEGTELPDPATHVRGDNANKWQGNIATPLHNHLGGSDVSGCPACAYYKESKRLSGGCVK